MDAIIVEKTIPLCSCEVVLEICDGNACICTEPLA